jgi:hypothetical protein
MYAVTTQLHLSLARAAALRLALEVYIHSFAMYSLSWSVVGLSWAALATSKGTTTTLSLRPPAAVPSGAVQGAQSFVR